jgi:mannose-6-phosphate isomerase-like protein (cupin superfamily)
MQSTSEGLAYCKAVIASNWGHSHEQDELYIVFSGSGTLVLDDSRILFSPGDVLFVPARKPHHFESFTPNLVTWAVFWGAVGGEELS